MSYTTLGWARDVTFTAEKAYSLPIMSEPKLLPPSSARPYLNKVFDFAGWILVPQPSTLNPFHHLELIVDPNSGHAEVEKR